MIDKRWDLDAEALVVGGVLVGLLESAERAGVKAEHFFSEVHELVFAAAVRARDSSTVRDRRERLRHHGTRGIMMQVAEELFSRGVLGRCGGTAYLGELYECSKHQDIIDFFESCERIKVCHEERLRWRQQMGVPT